MAWTDAEKRMFQILNQKVDDLSKKLSDCCGSTNTCKCECMQQPWRVRTNIDIYYLATNEEGENYYGEKTAEELSLQDRFPETSCDGQKGDLLCDDGVVFCSYHLESNGNPTGWYIDGAYHILRP